MAHPPSKPPRKAKPSATGLRDATTTGGQDIVSMAMQKTADDVARLEESLKKTAKRAAAKKTGAPDPAADAAGTGLPFAAPIAAATQAPAATASDGEPGLPPAAAVEAQGSETIGEPATVSTSEDLTLAPSEDATAPPVNVEAGVVETASMPRLAEQGVEPTQEPTTVPAAEASAVPVAEEAGATAAEEHPAAAASEPVVPMIEAAAAEEAIVPPAADRGVSVPLVSAPPEERVAAAEPSFHGGSVDAPPVPQPDRPVADVVQPQARAEAADKAWRCGSFGLHDLDGLADGLATMNRIALDAFHKNAQMTLDFYTSLAGVKSVSDVLHLQLSLTRDSLHALREQTRGLTTAAQTLTWGGVARKAG